MNNYPPGVTGFEDFFVDGDVEIKKKSSLKDYNGKSAWKFAENENLKLFPHPDQQGGSVNEK